MVKEKKQTKLRTGPAGASLPPSLQLRALKVGQRTLDRYFAAVEAFEQWCRETHRKQFKHNLDKHATSYITHLYEQDMELSTGTYCVYGLQLLKCEVPKEQFLVNTKQALAGWRKIAPGRMRIPVPEEFLWDLGTFAVEQGRLDIAMHLVLQYDGYMRPSECLGLRAGQICPPTGRRYSHWGVILAPSELHETTKTGKSDDSILLGDLGHNQWVRECLRCWMKSVSRPNGELFPDLSLASLEHWCRHACASLKYKSTCVMPHIVRHAAASNDAYHRRRCLAEIQKRGRWECKKSCDRYNKHALLLHQWKQAPPNRVATIVQRSQSFPALLLQKLR